MKSIRIGLLFLLLSMKVAAGDFCIAPQFAYGKSAAIQFQDNPYELEILHLFRNSDDIMFLRTGALVSYELKWLSYNTGLLYSHVIADEQYGGWINDLNMVQWPLGCNLHFGQRLYGYLNLGAYLNYLYSKREWAEVQFPSFQPGIAGGIGIGYCFGPSFSIDLSYQAEYGLRPLYSLWLGTGGISRGGYWSDQYVPFRTLTLSLKYTPNRKKQ